MLGFLLIGAFAIYYLMPKPITGPSSIIAPVPVPPMPSVEELEEKASENQQITIPKNGVIDLFAVPSNSH